MNSGREFKELQATPEDAIAMAQGYRFTVRYGKQNYGYFATQSDAFKAAAKSDATAYAMQRYNSSSRIILNEVSGLSSVDTPAEIMARKIMEYIGATDGPISPLAKQRVVAILSSACPNNGLSEEVFLVLYPASSKEQFNRLWHNSVAGNHTPSKTTAHQQRTESPVHVGAKTPIELFDEYAISVNLGCLSESIVSNDTQLCVRTCVRLNIDSRKFDDLLDSAVNFGVISDEYRKLASKHLVRSIAESRINGDILSLIRNNTSLIGMAENNDNYGIIEDLRCSGYGKREAEELAGEIISLNKVLSNMKN